MYKVCVASRGAGGDVGRRVRAEAASDAGPTPDRVEWPTIVVAAAIAVGFAATLAWHERMPIAGTVVVLAVLSGWYGSLQHEVVHGHPTPWRRVNTMLGIVPIGLVVRFGDYRRSHLAHHATPSLTDPDLDPESFYVSPERWQRSGRIARAAHRATFTLSGRLLLGPIVVAVRTARRDLASIRTLRDALARAGQATGLVAVLAVVHLSGMPLWVYGLGAGWGGSMVSLLRSFAEHLGVDEGTRSAVVRSNRVGSLLFLNNNLHHTHHARPGVAWFALPAVHEATGADGLAAAGAGVYAGYGEVARRFMFRALDDPVREPRDARTRPGTDVLEPARELGPGASPRWPAPATASASSA
jgi:fatty acid desaturase